MASIFLDGPPDAETEKGERARADDHVPETDAANIVVFADSDFFDDRFWVSEQNYLGQRFGVPIADNGKFLLNAVENMMGSSDLISLRGREDCTTLHTCRALRRAAEAQYLAEEENLMARIEVAQNELDRIEREGAQLGDAERAARQYRVELVAARKALRDVQGNLRRDIDTLAGQVTFVNIVVMPILVGLAALALHGVNAAAAAQHKLPEVCVM